MWENKLYVIQVTDSVICNNTNFRNSSHLAKTIMVRVGTSIWIECALKMFNVIICLDKQFYGNEQTKFIL